MALYKVLPLCSQVRKDDTFWYKPMDIACYMCGVNPSVYSTPLKLYKHQYAINPRPYPLLSDMDGRKERVLEAFEIVCRTCMKNAPFTGRRIYHSSQLTTWNTELLESILYDVDAPGRTPLLWKSPPKQTSSRSQHSGRKVIDTIEQHNEHNEHNEDNEDTDDMWLPQVPPMLALIHFGGPLEWIHYNDADSVWPYPTTQNPYEMRPYNGTDLNVFQRDFTQTSLCCWGCLQPLGKDGSVPTFYDNGLVQGLFHPSGRCALRFLLEYGGMHWKSRTVASLKMWQKDFGMTSMIAESLRPAPDRRLLKVLGGIFTLDEYLNEQHILHVRDSFTKTYPYYMRIEPDTNLEIIMYEDSATYELQPFDENLAIKVTRKPHLLRDPSAGDTIPWRIQLSLMTIEYDSSSVLGVTSASNDVAEPDEQPGACVEETMDEDEEGEADEEDQEEEDELRADRNVSLSRNVVSGEQRTCMRNKKKEAHSSDDDNSVRHGRNVKNTQKRARVAQSVGSAYISDTDAEHGGSSKMVSEVQQLTKRGTKRTHSAVVIAARNRTIEPERTLPQMGLNGTTIGKRIKL